MLGYLAIHHMYHVQVFNFPNQQSPLHLAALGGYVDTVRCLADRGADTNIKDGLHGVRQ